MQLDNRLYERQELRQHLALNADILQSLEVLRLPMQELRELLVQKTYENPLLELDEPPEETEGETPVELPEPDAPDDPDDGVVVDAAQNDLWSAGAAGGDVYLAAGGSEESFTETLYQQLGALKLDPGFAALCRYLVACLDRKGYFTEPPEEIPPEEIAGLLGCTPFDVMQALYLVQSLEPAGVGARSLEECLLLQLVQSHTFNQYTIRLVKDGMALLAAGDLKGIAALLQTDEDTAKEACRVVRGLNPIPSQGYYTGEARQTVIPDAAVEKAGEGFTVVYNQRSMPTLGLSREYTAMIPTLADPEAKEYLKRNLGEARQLIKAVEKRESTLTRIITQIVRLQPKFFEDGLSLAPMTLEAVADQLELNISTISRAVQGKYIKCAAGTVEIKSLFTTGVKSAAGEMVSAAMVKRMIKGFVEAEDPQKPLSDEAIRHALEVAKVNISRRTVAKYREEMAIPASSARKRL